MRTALACILLLFGATASASRAADGHAHGERPIPAFSGRTLSGDSLSISSFIGKRLVIFFFNPETDESQILGAAMAPIDELQRKFNYAVVGVSVGSTSEKSRAFVTKHGLDFPIIDDSRAEISRTFGLQQPYLMLGVDGDGYLSWSIGYVNTDTPDPIAIVEDQLRERLRLPARSDATASSLTQPTPAPPFTAARMTGGTFEFASLEGKPAVVIFFLHTCPHCHSALAFLKEHLAKIPEEKRPELVGISLGNQAREVRNSLERLDLDFFDVLLDPSGDLANLYGVFGGVPVLNFIDAKGNIAHRVEGWNKKRDPSLSRMYLAKIAGVKIPMLLNRKGYTGSDACGVCHEFEYSTWQFTQHATAFGTLVTHGADRDPECVGCHSVGFDEPGGFNLDDKPPHLENVGCESCHGRGGPHLPGAEKVVDYTEACLVCHDTKHSLGFDYATFRPLISHAGIASLSEEQRQSLLANRAKPRSVLPTGAALVGSDACQSCHASEFETWSASAHGHSIDSLARTKDEANAECLQCHTTGFAKPGGFDPDAKAEGQPDFARVGCESCHGPGGDHVADGAVKIGTIVSLGDKCDSCVILQICGTCHDDANDPNFEFSVEKRIEEQRHGTTEAGTGKPLAEPKSAASEAILPDQIGHALAVAERQAAR